MFSDWSFHISTTLCDLFLSGFSLLSAGRCCWCDRFSLHHSGMQTPVVSCKPSESDRWRDYSSLRVLHIQKEGNKSKVKNRIESLSSGSLANRGAQKKAKSVEKEFKFNSNFVRE
jgi:hypothetical protein